LHVELRADVPDEIEPDTSLSADDVPVVANEVNFWQFTGTLLDVQLVSETAQQK
jgi:uncharacterized protein YneR